MACTCGRIFTGVAAHACRDQPEQQPAKRRQLDKNARNVSSNSVNRSSATCSSGGKARCREVQLGYSGLLQPHLQGLLSVVHIAEGSCQIHMMNSTSRHLVLHGWMCMVGKCRTECRLLSSILQLWDANRSISRQSVAKGHFVNLLLLVAANLLLPAANLLLPAGG